MNRDPRIDPKPGDILKAPGGTATITAVEDGHVKYLVEGGDRKPNHHGKVTLEFWRSRSKDFGIVKVAEDGAS